jgi:hypothetical protein
MLSITSHPLNSLNSLSGAPWWFRTTHSSSYELTALTYYAKGTLQIKLKVELKCLGTRSNIYKHDGCGQHSRLSHVEHQGTWTLCINITNKVFHVSTITTIKMVNI